MVSVDRALARQPLHRPHPGCQSERERDLERNKFRVFRLHFVGSIIPFERLSTLLSANKASRCDLFRFWVQKRYTLFFRRAISVERLSHTRETKTHFTANGVSLFLEGLKT